MNSLNLKFLEFSVQVSRDLDEFHTCLGIKRPVHITTIIITITGIITISITTIITITIITIN